MRIRDGFKDLKPEGLHRTGTSMARVSIAVKGALCGTVVEQTIVQPD